MNIPAALKGRIAQAVAGGAVAIAAAVVIWFEGIETKPYLDPISIPTVCVGHTGKVDMGRVYSDAECEALLKGDLGTAFATVDRHVRVPIGDETPSRRRGLMPIMPLRKQLMHKSLRQRLR